jgi:hypothetical protein
MDDHANVIGPWRRDELAGYLIEEHAAQKGRIGTRVEQMERAVPEKPLTPMNKVERQTEGPFTALTASAERRDATKVDPNIRVSLPIYGKLCGDLHVGILEVRQLFLPVLVFELEENRP